MTQRALVVVNPAANHGEAGRLTPTIDRLLASLPHDLVLTPAPLRAAELVAQARGYDLVVAAGGDGTVHEVLNGVMSHPEDRRPALGVLPIGTGNDYARALGVSFDMAKAAKQLVTGVRRRMDVGVANGVYFANSIAMGFDAKVAAKAGEMKTTTGWSGLPLYLRALFAVLFRDFFPHRVELAFDDQPFTRTDLTLVAVMNGPTYGGGFRVTPGAVGDDGLFDILVIDAVPLWEALWRLPFVIVGRHGWMRPVHLTAEHTRLRVRSEVPLPGQIDGEVMLATDYDVSILPGSLECIVPRTA